MLPAHLTIETVKEYGPIKVFLDGEPVDMVVEANTKEGWLTKYKQTDAGGLIELVMEGDEIATETLHGVVTAELAEAH